VLYSFGDCVLDTERRELRRAAALVGVEPLVFDLLVNLIRHRQHVVSRADLTAAIWKVPAVSDAVIDSRIYEARCAIGDSGKKQRFIRTMPRKGFRFVGEVQEDEPLAPFKQALAKHASAEVGENGEVSVPGGIANACGATIPTALERNSSARRLPTMPALLIGRDDDLVRLRFAISDNKPRRPITVVRGWPGVGKTSLVNALAYDSETAKAFPDGVLWAAVGEFPNPLGELLAWLTALGVDPKGSPSRLDDIVAEVRSLLRERQILLIVDDVLDISAAVPFKVAGPRCATLITTRSAEVARELATTPTDVYRLGELDETKGLELLTLLAPSVVKEHQAESRRLVADLEGLPLALRVAGRLLHAEAQFGWGGIQELLAELSEKSRLLLAIAPHDRHDPRTGITPTVSLLLERSTDRLDSQTRNRFADLGAFASKPATFDLNAMRGVWGGTDIEDAKETARKLADRGLLEPIGKGRFQMHALLVLHARLLMAK
jgi:DNA-binding winged helix-turn-helix (wHTH) protein